MMVMCKKQGLVAQGTCGRCNCYEEPKTDDPWSNPKGVCAHFRYIVRSEQEEKELGMKYLYPGSAAHERASNQLRQNEDRDTDKTAIKRFPIVKPLPIPKCHPRKIQVS
jgi:hypothetical protein